MKKTCRNALRSKAMIRQAFLELLEEKELAELQQQAYAGLMSAFDQALGSKCPEDLLPMLRRAGRPMCCRDHGNA
ncbi:MAG: hypothetical protein ACI4JC_09305 [Faecalibacterium sp.]